MDRSAEYFSRQYNNVARVPEHAEFVTRWKWASDFARHTERGCLDLAYGDCADEKLDIFLTQDQKAPLLVFIHGGWWRRFSKDDFSFVAPAYTKAGINVAVTDYTLAPQASIADIVSQQRRALVWLYRNAARYCFDASRIVVAGHSAGGQLTAMMLATAWAELEADLPQDLVKAGVALSGVYDLAPLIDVDFLKDDLRLTSDNVGAISPARLRQQNGTPFITAFGGEEAEEFERQAALIEQHWHTQHRARIDLPGVNHFSICDEFASSASSLFGATTQLIASLKEGG